MIKYFVSDLDGTLLYNYEWNSIIQKSIINLLEDGYEFVVATGRTVKGIKNCKGLWELPVYLIVLNGGMILDKERNVIFTKSICPSVVNYIYNTFLSYNLEFITDKGVMTPLSKEKYIMEYSKWDLWQKKLVVDKEKSVLRNHLNSISFDVSKEQLLNNSILKINALQLDNIKYDEMIDEIKQIDDEIINSPFTSHVLEITSKNISKAKALQFLLSINNWHIDEVAVFGDGGNDIEMLENFLHSYVPNNASKDIKKYASEIIDSCNDYGVLKKINEIINQYNVKKTEFKS